MNKLFSNKKLYWIAIIIIVLLFCLFLEFVVTKPTTIRDEVTEINVQSINVTHYSYYDTVPAQKVIITENVEEEIQNISQNVGDVKMLLSRTGSSVSPTIDGLIEIVFVGEEREVRVVINKYGSMNMTSKRNNAIPYRIEDEDSEFYENLLRMFDLKIMQPERA